jgi:hypothetical protein
METSDIIKQRRDSSMIEKEEKRAKIQTIVH